MSGETQKRKDQINKQKSLKVEQAMGRIGVHFNHNKRCLVSTWVELAQKLGLSQGDIVQLKEAVRKAGLQGPRR